MNICRTSKAWSELCESSKLWIVLLNRDFPIAKGFERPKMLTKKEQYIYNMFNVRLNLVFTPKYDPVNIQNTDMPKDECLLTESFVTSSRKMFAQMFHSMLNYSTDAEKELMHYFNVKNIRSFDEEKVNYVFGYTKYPYVTILLTKVPPYARIAIYNTFSQMKRKSAVINHIRYFVEYEPFDFLAGKMITK